MMYINLLFNTDFHKEKREETKQNQIKSSESKQ